MYRRFHRDFGLIQGWSARAPGELSTATSQCGMWVSKGAKRLPESVFHVERGATRGLVAPHSTGTGIGVAPLSLDPHRASTPAVADQLRGPWTGLLSPSCLSRGTCTLYPTLKPDDQRSQTLGLARDCPHRAARL